LQMPSLARHIDHVGENGENSGFCSPERKSFFPEK
jgi:hypothetical protein